MMGGSNLDESKYYLIPGYQVLLTMGELKETQDVAAHFLKFYVEQSEVSSWDSTAVPDMAELYSGSRACIRLLEELMKQEPPPEYREKVTGGGVCVSGDQYMGFVGLLQMIQELKRTVSVVHNVSFEVH
tara:strand:- start:869 stop:1255 length:387 start_codon:yes stop_codon:yes gene_type:complete